MGSRRSLQGPCLVAGPGLAPDVFAFAEIQLTEPGASPDLHLPVAVRPASDNFPDAMAFDISVQNGDALSQGLQSATPITNLNLDVSGLVEGTQTAVSLNEDPTNGNAFDNLAQVFVKTVNVPLGTKRLVAMTTSEEAPDVDLFVGTGAIPSAGTQVCGSTTPEATERCDLADPAAGTYWIVVQNWSGSGSQPDLIDLVDAVVPTSGSGNLTIDGPNVVAAGGVFQLDLDWNLPGASVGDVFFGSVAVGTDAGSPGNLGEIGLDMHFVFSDSIFADGFESGNTSAWSSAVP